MKRKNVLKRWSGMGLLTLVFMAILSGCGQPEVETYTPAPLDENLTYYAVIEIEEYGAITVELNQSEAPITCANFVELADGGFYDGLTFHRIIEDFMMQGGAPKEAEAQAIVGEFASNGIENNLAHTRGAISMARTKVKNSASSQFFIVHADSPHLDGDYAAFGYVVEGIEVVDLVCQSSNPVDGNGTIAEEDQPVIKTITIKKE